MEAVKNIQGKTIGYCGAGGKTTSLFFMAKKLIKINEKVLITTTTKMFPEVNCKNIEIVIRETLFESDLKHGVITQWLAKIDVENKGIAPQLAELEKVNKYTDVWKLIEIDGSKHLPIKAPREGEPVYINGLSHVYGVIGARSFEAPASENVVHRLKEFLEVTGLEAGEAIDPEAVAKLINSPMGLFRNKPEGLSVSVLITQVEERHRDFIERLKGLTLVPIEVMPWLD